MNPDRADPSEPSGIRVGPVGDPDRYTLGAAVASGSEGILYRGSIVTATGVQLEVAIKMLQPRFFSRVDDWHTRWIEQVELLRSLQVPGVVPVRDGFIGPLPHPPGHPGEGRSLYMVMNWVAGEPLDTWVRHRPDRDPLDALGLLIPVAAALDLMHSGRATGGVPVVHRDVKPANIVVTDHTTVLVDFGLVRGLPDGERLTAVVGTPGYLAPESSESGTYSPASDRYAFGAVAYFVVTGIEPPDDHQPDTLQSLLASAPTLSPHPELADAIMAMLATDPAARPAGLANWIGQLRRSSLEPGPSILSPQAATRHPSARPLARPPSRKKPSRRRPPSRRSIALLAALLALAVLVVALVVYLPPSSPRVNQAPPRAAFGELDSTCGRGQPVQLSLGAAVVPGAVGVGPAGTVAGVNYTDYNPQDYPGGPPSSQLIGLEPDCSVIPGYPPINLPDTLHISLAALTVVRPSGSSYAVGSDGTGWVVTKFRSSGFVDPTFGSDRGLNLHPDSPADASAFKGTIPPMATGLVVTKSRIFAVGTDGGDQTLLLSLRLDGSADLRFGTNGIVHVDRSSILPLITQMSDGSLLVGDSYAYPGCGGFTIEKYTSSGNRDAAFDKISATGTESTGCLMPINFKTPASSQARLWGLVSLPGNQFAAIGYAFGDSPSEGASMFVLRFRPNGSIDRGFGNNGLVMLRETISDPSEQPSTSGAVAEPGGGLVVPVARSTGVFLAYLTATGRVDEQIHVPTPSVSSPSTSTSLAPSPSASPTIVIADAGHGKVQVIAEASPEAWTVARYLAAGS